MLSLIKYFLNINDPYIKVVLNTRTDSYKLDSLQFYLCGCPGYFKLEYINLHNIRSDKEMEKVFKTTLQKARAEAEALINKHKAREEEIESLGKKSKRYSKQYGGRYALKE